MVASQPACEYCGSESVRLIFYGCFALWLLADQHVNTVDPNQADKTVLKGVYPPIESFDKRE
jgi:hypothetical protein